MQRRSLLRSSLSVGTLSVAGCLALNFDSEGRSGVNEKLEIRNNLTETVLLHVVVERDELDGSQDKETVFERDVSIPAGQTKVLEVLGDTRFHILVTRSDQEMTFSASPICSQASTMILVTETGELENKVEDCE